MFTLRISVYFENFNSHKFSVKIQIFCDVTLCPWAKGFLRFERLSFIFRVTQCSSVTKYQGVQYLTAESRDWCDFSQSILSIRFDLRLIRGHFIWGHKSNFTHLDHTEGEGIYPENEGNITFRNFRNFTPTDTSSQPRSANVLPLLIRGTCALVTSFPTYGVSTSRSALLLFAPRPNLLNQARKYLRTLLNMSSSCRTPKMRPRSTILLQFGSKTPLNKPRNLSLSLRRGPWRFWSWLMA